jgi:uncharacterized protein (DUF1015 family)
LQEHSLAKISPFRGLYYNSKKIDDLSLVATPPYDVISPDDERRYRERHPYNIIRIILPEGKDGNDRYQEAARYLRLWEDEGILIRDKKPSFYPYQQIFESPSGEMTERNGFIALGKLEALGPGGILPHEKTSPKPVEDRLRLTEACSANLSQVFALYSDPEGKIDGQLAMVWKTLPRYEFRDDAGVIHRFWQLSNQDIISHIENQMQNKTLIIADGHHRYTTALLYRDKMRAQYPSFSVRSPFEYTMLYFTPLEGRGLFILPTHRLVSSGVTFDRNIFYDNLNKYFLMSDFIFSEDEEKKMRSHFFKSLDEKRNDAYTFGLYLGGENRYIRCNLKKEVKIKELLVEYPEALRELDVTLLDGIILKKFLKISEENLVYLKERDEALEEVHRGRYAAAFLMNPPTVQQLKGVVNANEIMPRKTTFFYPKVATGLVLNKIIPTEEIA